MDKQFLFFNMSYEQVKHQPGGFFRILFIPIGYVGMHWHKEIELLWVLKGTVRIQNSRMSCLAEEGDLFWINSSEIHGLIEGEGDNLLLVLQIDPSALQGFTGEPFGDRYLLTPREPIPEAQSGAIRHALAQIMALTASQPPGYACFSTARVFDILGIVRERCAVPAEHETETPRYDIRIKRILDHLNHHYREPLALADLADTFHLSTFHLSRFIRERTGFTFQEHLNFLRLNHAVDLMMNTDFRLVDISMEAGFSDPKYMNRAFQSLFGMTPRELRDKENWREQIKNRFGAGNTDWETYRCYLEPYL